MNELLPFSPVPSSKKFARWFGSSKVTDADGQPLAMFHGSAYHFREFRGDRGFYFTSDAEDAAGYAEAPDCCVGSMEEEVEPVLYSVFLSIRRPLELDGDNPTHEGKFVSWQFEPSDLPQNDGVIMRYADGKVEVIAFLPAQIWIVGKNGRHFNPDEDFSEPAYYHDTQWGTVVKLRGV